MGSRFPYGTQGKEGPDQGKGMVTVEGEMYSTVVYLDKFFELMLICSAAVCEVSCKLLNTLEARTFLKDLPINNNKDVISLLYLTASIAI